MDSKYKRIICNKCKKDTGYTEEVIIKQEELKEDIKCPHCGAVIIPKKEEYC